MYSFFLLRAVEVGKKTRRLKMNLTFIYFDFPFWRAEVGKIALYFGGIDFEDRKIIREEFLRAQANGHLDDGTIIPFHQFPCLIVDGVPIADTGGIGRFCGKLSGLYPINDDFLAARIDQFLDLGTDINFLVSASGGTGDEEKIKANRQELSKGELPRKLKMLERSIAENSDWIVESDISIADIAIWRLMGWLSSGTIDGIPTDLLKDFPKIRRVCLAVDAHQKVQEWIEKTYPKNYERGNYL